MSLEGAAEYWRKRLTEGQPIYRVRVRRLLELAGAKRRGFVISERIRKILDSNGLETDPDFESAWIEAQLQIRLKGGPDVPSAEVEEGGDGNAALGAVGAQPIDPIDAAEDPGSEDAELIDPDVAPVADPLNSPAGAPGLIDVSATPQIDVQMRFESVPSANRGVVSVRPNDKLVIATTKMRFEGYSQLAIMQGDYQVSGMISWESIAKRSLDGHKPVTVADCREDAQVIDASRPLHDGIPAIERFGYVLVRSKQNKITGIVTATDLLGEFGRISFAFMRLRSIELSIRDRLKHHLLEQDFESLEEHSRARVEKNWELLTFGECARMLERPEVWARSAIPVDRVIFTQRLNEIKDIRNDVMHFSPDPLDAGQRKNLDQMEALLSEVL